MISLKAAGYGLAALLGLGAVLLAAIQNPTWSVFLGAAVLVWVISLLARKI
jgi:S1-C subfamily serine protease